MKLTNPTAERATIDNRQMRDPLNSVEKDPLHENEMEAVTAPKKKKWLSYDEQVRQAIMALKGGYVSKDVYPNEKECGAVSGSIADKCKNEPEGTHQPKAHPTEAKASKPVGHNQKSDPEEVLKALSLMEEEDGVVVGAAAVVGLFGLLVIGPLVGFVTAIGAAYVAASDQGAVGNALRTSGTVVIAVGHRSRELEEEHQIIAKIGRRLEDIIDRFAAWIAWKLRKSAPIPPIKQKYA